jgi:hypothetical protein
MKIKLLLLLSLLICNVGLSQLTTINPDTVCYQTPGSIYEIPNTPGYTYNWVVSSPGIINNGQGTNSILVDWSNATPGLIPSGVSVNVVDANGCTAEVDLDIFIYQVLPIINLQGPFCPDEPCVTLTATPIGGVFSGSGVTGNQFCPLDAGIGNHTITYTVTVNGCTFTTTIVYVVNPGPTLTPIQHN